MYIAMNRFQVAPGNEEAFEKVWTSRDTFLAGVPGFVEFHLLRGPALEDHTLFSSHTVWRSRADFEAMNRAVAAHRIRPAIDKVFAFEDAAAEGAEERLSLHRVVALCAEQVVAPQQHRQREHADARGGRRAGLDGRGGGHVGSEVVRELHGRIPAAQRRRQVRPPYDLGIP